MEDKFQLETVAKLENLAMIADFVHHSLLAFALDERTVFQIQMAVDEASSNIMLHGYPQKKGKIHITCSRKEEKVIIILEDWGKSWDPGSVKKPNMQASLEEREIGGLGIHLIKTVMDEVQYKEENGKNILTMIKSV